MKTLDELINKINDFRDVRNWRQFHNFKDMALSLSLEVSEVIEHFQWKNRDEVKEYVKKNKKEIGEELADVLYWVLLMSHDLEIDILETLDKKIDKNDKKYPVSKSKNKHTKYNKLK